jgi:hypothetical protein
MLLTVRTHDRRVVLQVRVKLYRLLVQVQSLQCTTTVVWLLLLPLLKSVEPPRDDSVHGVSVLDWSNSKQCLYELVQRRNVWLHFLVCRQIHGLFVELGN